MHCLRFAHICRLSSFLIYTFDQSVRTKDYKVTCLNENLYNLELAKLHIQFHYLYSLIEPADLSLPEIFNRCYRILLSTDYTSFFYYNVNNVLKQIITNIKTNVDILMCSTRLDMSKS